MTTRATRRDKTLYIQTRTGTFSRRLRTLRTLTLRAKLCDAIRELVHRVFFFFHASPRFLPPPFPPPAAASPAATGSAPTWRQPPPAPRVQRLEVLRAVLVDVPPQQRVADFRLEVPARSLGKAVRPPRSGSTRYARHVISPLPASALPSWHETIRGARGRTNRGAACTPGRAGNDNLRRLRVRRFETAQVRRALDRRAHDRMRGRDAAVVRGPTGGGLAVYSCVAAGCVSSLRRLVSHDERGVQLRRGDVDDRRGLFGDEVVNHREPRVLDTCLTFISRP